MPRHSSRSYGADGHPGWFLGGAALLLASYVAVGSSNPKLADDALILSVPCLLGGVFAASVFAGLRYRATFILGATLVTLPILHAWAGVRTESALVDDALLLAIPMTMLGCLSLLHAAPRWYLATMSSFALFGGSLLLLLLATFDVLAWLCALLAHAGVLLVAVLFRD